MNEQNPIDYESALERTGGDEDFLNELLDLYFEEYAKFLSVLKQAIEDKDFSQIQENGHSLKGSSGNLSLPFLQQAAFEMEKAGKTEDIEAARKALSQLDREFQSLKKYLAG
jgi:HPt (histidine-containing phosphotransfer) domain-containing protein